MVFLTPFNVPKEEYEGLIARREYWDDCGDEWSWNSIEEKIVRLAQFVQQGGNLSKIINRYAKNVMKGIDVESSIVWLPIRNRGDRLIVLGNQSPVPYEPLDDCVSLRLCLLNN